MCYLFYIYGVLWLDILLPENMVQHTMIRKQNQSIIEVPHFYMFSCVVRLKKNK